MDSAEFISLDTTLAVMIVLTLAPLNDYILPHIAVMDCQANRGNARNVQKDVPLCHRQ